VNRPISRAAGATAGELPVPSRRPTLVIISALMLRTTLAALDQTIVSTALPNALKTPGHLRWGHRSIDYAGTIILAMAAASLVLLTSLGGTTYR
jgi:hypothetical protein